MESNPLHPLVIPLYGSTTHFPWGTPGQQSLAAHVGSLNRFGAIDPEKPYSEFVITTHSQHSEAVLASTPSVSLREHIHNQVIEVDSSVVDFYSKLHAKGIPYSLKIACVSTPQSLHAHPSDATVKAFASQEPSSGMDTTSKSVMLVALSKVDMLFGFQAASDIVNELSRVPEFAAAVGRTETDQFVHIVKSAKVKHSHIRVIFTNLFSRTREFMQKCLCATIERMERMPEDALTEKDMQLVELHKLYPDDPACFSVYFLNHIHLEPGNAVFVHPQEPYSILKGQYIEASSCSESSVDGGLTNEEVRIPQFLESLSYDDSAVEVSVAKTMSFINTMNQLNARVSSFVSSEDLTFCPFVANLQVSDGERFSDSGVSFVPPVPDFQLLEFKLPHNTAQQMAETMYVFLLLFAYLQNCSVCIRSVQNQNLTRLTFTLLSISTSLDLLGFA